MESNEKIKTNENWLKLILRLALMLFLITLLVILSFFVIDTKFYPVFFPVVPIFYIICGIILGNFAINTGKTQNGTPLKKVMIIRSIRVIGSIIILIGGIAFDTIHAIPFVIIFAIYYVSYLLFETKVMTDLNKTNKV